VHRRSTRVAAIFKEAEWRRCAQRPGWLRRKAAGDDVAAPVRDRSGAVVAAMSVSGRPDQFEALTQERVAREVVERASYVSGRLGFLQA
jgi:hypothetical protein